MERYLIFFSIVAAVAANTGFDYCTLNCHLPNGTEVKHFACGETGDFGPDCPAVVSLVNMDEPMKKVILHEHNKLRNFVAGGGNETHKYKPACRMGTLQWSDELAAVSVFQSKKCTFKPASCRGTEKFPNSSQFYNDVYYVIPKNSSAIDSFKKVISSNVDTILNATSIDFFVDRNTHVGCSGIYQPIEPKYKAFRYDCFHGTDIPAGASMYSECEKPASGCKTGQNPEFPNLCSTDEQYEN